MLELTYEECQKSPCFMCKSMETRLKEFGIQIVLARCKLESKSFPAAKCELFTPEIQKHA